MRRVITALVTKPGLATAPLVDLAGPSGLLFVHGRRGLVGIGHAMTVDLDEAVETLAAIPQVDLRQTELKGPGDGAVALGAVNFLPGTPATLIVPRILVADDGDGCRRISVVDESDLPPQDVIDRAFDELVVHPAPHAVSSSYEVRPIVPIDQYLEAVATARDAVRNGELHKAVIARPIEIISDRPMDLHAIGRRLENTFGSTYRFSIDGFIGASPELLVEVNGDIVRSRPLAGTTRTTGDPELDTRLADELMNSEKNQIEHRAAIEMVRETLLPHCSYLDWTPHPSIVKVANVQHLGSTAEGMLSQPAASVVELLRALQPTPAVGGHPRAVALELIERVEGFERGRYGGAVGWVDGSGDGEWAVSLRCAEFSADRTRARLVAGGGIVADSEPLAELAETQAKFQAMLGAIIRP